MRRVAAANGGGLSAGEEHDEIFGSPSARAEIRLVDISPRRLIREAVFSTELVHDHLQRAFISQQQRAQRRDSKVRARGYRVSSEAAHRAWRPTLSPARS